MGKCYFDTWSSSAEFYSEYLAKELIQENIWNTSTNQGECGESGVFGEDKQQIVCHGQAEEKRRCIGNGAELGRSYVDESVRPDMEKEIGVCPVLS